VGKRREIYGNSYISSRFEKNGQDKCKGAENEVDTRVYRDAVYVEGGRTGKTDALLFVRIQGPTSKRGTSILGRK